MTAAEMDERLARLTRGEGVAVDVRAIERELATMWTQASEHASTVARACVWNLVARVADEAALDAAKETLSEVVRAWPARLLWLRAAATQPGDATDAEGPEVDAELSAHCHLAPGGGKLVCSEEVTLRARGDGHEHLPALVRALLVPDVPAALLELGAEPAHPEVVALGRLVERVVVDTGAMAGVEALGGLARASLPQVADLGWLRTEPWRLLWASLFDAPVGAAPLRFADELRVVAAPGGEASAGLFIGWLAERLAWSAPVPVAGEGRAWRFTRADGGETRVTLASGGPAAQAAGAKGHPLAGLSVTGAFGRYQLEDAGQEHARASGDGVPTRLLSTPERSDAELIVAALGARGQDPRFGAALARASELCP